MPFKNKKEPYFAVMCIILVVFIVIFSARVFSIQVINAEKYSSASAGLVSRTAPIKAARGEILDCYGRKIAVNRDGYDIVFNGAYINYDTVNELLAELIPLAEKHGSEYVDNLPIEKSGTVAFIKDADARVKKLKRILNVADYATAQNCYDRLCEKYSLQNYGKAMQRKIMGVRYSMEAADFSISTPYTFAEDVSDEFMLVISEASYILKGVTVAVTPYREYPVTDLAPHLIGSTGPIYEEEWEEYKAKGYSYNDRIGKSGIELYAEEDLHGTDGEITYQVDAEGKIVSSKVTKEPIAGKTVMLTIDKNLQQNTQTALAKLIKSFQKSGSSVTGGAVVVMSVKSGAVLTSANYPSYDAGTLSKDYDKLVADKRTPLLDRAFQGIYPIGSAIKPAVAIAALESGKYKLGETVNCRKKYKYFEDYQPSCLHHHGTIALKAALAKSCNYFFFEMGRRVGIKNLNKYLTDFGFGEYTGVQVNDSRGILNKFENDSGNTLQVSIGQLNAFTPLQVANYACTLANGGTHYNATIISRVVSPDFRTTYKVVEASAKNTVKINPTYLKAVKEGMLSVTEDGTGSAVFSKYAVKVGGKTGTSQVNKGRDHNIFMAFAPYDDPEIAIAVVLEHAQSSLMVTTVARAVFDNYFFTQNTQNADVLPYKVLR